MRGFYLIWWENPKNLCDILVYGVMRFHVIAEIKIIYFFSCNLSRPVSVHQSLVAQKVFKCEVFIWFGDKTPNNKLCDIFSDSIYRLSCRTCNITNFVWILRPASLLEGENTWNLNITHNTQIIILIMSALLDELLWCMKNDIKRIINLIICNHLNFNLFSSLILSFLYTLKIVCNSY